MNKLLIAVIILGVLGIGMFCLYKPETITYIDIPAKELKGVFIP